MEKFIGYLLILFVITCFVLINLPFWSSSWSVEKREVVKAKKRDSDFRQQENLVLKQKVFQTATMWEKELKELGENSDLEKLERIVSSNNFQEGWVPWEVLFTREDFHYLLSYYKPENVYSVTNDGYKNGAFTIDTIETAVYVKNLVAHIKEIKKAKEMLNKEFWSTGSETMREKWITLDKMESKTKHEISRAIYFKKFEGTVFRLCFSKTAILPEEDLVEAVDEIIKKGMPVAKTRSQLDKDSLQVTSPALVDLNQFLNQNELPDDVYTELQTTIRQIENRLRKEKESEAEADIRLEAEVRTKTAKEYHQIS